LVNLLLRKIQWNAEKTKILKPSVIVHIRLAQGKGFAVSVFHIIRRWENFPPVIFQKKVREIMIEVLKTLFRIIKKETDSYKTKTLRLVFEGFLFI
jgi:hypothetical protein